MNPNMERKKQIELLEMQCLKVSVKKISVGEVKAF